MLDIRLLQRFYASSAGKHAEGDIQHHIQAISRAQKDDLVAALGYAMPYIPALAHQSTRRLVLMPASLGAVLDQPYPQCLTHPHLLPLADASLHSLLMVHSLEHVTDDKSVLREAWRVLQDDGNLIIVLPYRLGLWARQPDTPFGHGRPYSRVQIRQLLETTGFAVTNIQRCLHYPPVQSHNLLRLFLWLKPIMRYCVPGLAGILIVQARKSVLHPTPLTAAAIRGHRQTAWVATHTNKTIETQQNR